jgi:hypothetical protein
MAADVLIVRHYVPDDAACLAALRLLLDWSTQAERHPSPARVEDGARGPAKHSSGTHSVQQRRRRVKAARREQP